MVASGWRTIVTNEPDESEEQPEFPPAERKLVTNAYDLSVATLLEQWNDDVLVVPKIQREYVWDNGRASRLIESLLLNIPIPVVYFNEKSDATYEIIDGHQRIRSIVRYLANEFALSGIEVLAEYRRKRFHELPAREQRFLRMRILRAIIISHESHPNMKFEVFQRLNTGSVALRAQELRNSMYRGAFNELLKELVAEPTFRAVTGFPKARKRMVDEELILRFFALREGIEDYRPSLKRFLNRHMNAVKDADESQIEEWRNLFVETVAKVERLFGTPAFRFIELETGKMERNLNSALFDAQMLTATFASIPEDLDTSEARAAGQALFENQEFLDASRRATGDRSRTHTRVRMMSEAVTSGGVDVELPSGLD